MPLPIAGAMTAAAGLGRMAGAAVQTAVTAARSSRLAPVFQQLANKLRAFDPATLATLLQAGGAKPGAQAQPQDGASPQLLRRPPGAALAASLRDAVPRKPAAPAGAKPAAATGTATVASSHRPSELTPLLARAWDHLETTLGTLASTVPGGRTIGEEMLAIIGPRLRALSEELAPLLHGGGAPAADATPATAGSSAAEEAPAASEPPVADATPAAPKPPGAGKTHATAKPAVAAETPASIKPSTAEATPAPVEPPATSEAQAAAPPPTAEDTHAANELLAALKEMGENNAMDLVGAQPAPGAGQPQHGHSASHASGSEVAHTTESATTDSATTGSAPQQGARP